MRKHITSALLVAALGSVALSAPAQAAAGGGAVSTLINTGAAVTAQAAPVSVPAPSDPDFGSMDQITNLVGARAQWAAGNTGRGVDVAVIDTGVARVPGLTTVVNGPDLSFDSQDRSARYTDTFGHGTHMAGIVAGHDGAPGAGFTGVAPGARVVDVKTGGTNGVVDVTQVVAAITWVTKHAHDNGLNIRVINLSYGTNSLQSYVTDPLAYAAQMAWRAGILVVAAGGNDGAGSASVLANPALTPNLLAVGAEDPNGTATLADDVVPAFSQHGSALRHVDLVAPGTHVISLRVPNGTVDTQVPSSRVGVRFTRGSGTSQAAAVVSGAAALLFAARPGLTPDQAKWLLTTTAKPLPKTTALTAGAGLIDVDAAVRSVVSLPSATTLVNGLMIGNGLGSIEASRGTTHITMDGVPLAGERDIFGKPWQPVSFATSVATQNAWDGGRYAGSEWTGTGWTGPGDWSTVTWLGTSWTGRTWVDTAWSGRTWVDAGWAGRTWVDANWSSSSWS